MNKVAIIKTGGKQYKVSEGVNLKIEKLKAAEGETVKFDTLLTATEDGNDLKLGQPSLGEVVEAKVVSHGKGDKVSVVKYKNKTRYRRNVGHRQAYTEVKIEKIG